MSVYLDGKISKVLTYRDMINPLGKSIESRAQLEPSYDLIMNAKKTARMIDLFLDMNPDLSVRITAFYRSDDENERVGGSSTSDHRNALAVDFEVMDKNGKEVNERFVSWVNKHDVPFDQIILFNSINKPTAIHLGIGAKQREMFMLYTKGAGYTVIKRPQY